MIFGTLIFFQQTVHLDFPNAAKKQSRPADTGAHENPHTAVKNKESLGHTPRQQSGHCHFPGPRATAVALPIKRTKKETQLFIAACNTTLRKQSVITEKNEYKLKKKRKYLKVELRSPERKKKILAQYLKFSL